MKTILITGCAGLLGSRLADWILGNYPTAKVVGVDNLSGGFRTNVDQRVWFIRADAGSDYMRKVFDEWKPDIVYHFAAYAAEGLSPFIRKHNYTNNVVVTANIINECIRHHVQRLVFTSSMAAYGEPLQDEDNAIMPFSEDQALLPVDPYGVAKAACERDIQIAGAQHELDWCILRPHNIYGAKQNLWDVYRNFVGIAMYKLLRREPIPIFGDGLQTRAFSDIRDCLEPMWRAGTDRKASKQIINLGSPEVVTILDAARRIIKVAGFGRVEYLEPRHEVQHAHCTTEKSEDVLGFRHSTWLEEGIKDMWDWAKIQPDRPRTKWEHYELDKGMYSYWK
jgi:UDP-glucose 4-epimerase